MRTTWIRAAGTVLVAAALALAGAVLPAGAQEAEASGGNLVETCQPVAAAPEVGPRACKSLEAGTWLAAATCRRIPGTAEQVCPRIDGRDVSAAAMDAFEGSWLDRALELQGRLDLDVPLVHALLPHTHNSANSTAYDPSVSTLDANQVLTITDQLRLGIRAIELDVHWAPQPTGDPATGFRAVVQCHGQSVSGVHAGCSVDQPLGDRLAELRTWLESNPDEVVLLYLENVLDGDPVAHAQAVALLEQHLGALVHRPVAGAGCQGLPAQELSKADVLAAGHQVLLVGNCGPSGWDDWVFDRFPLWTESGGTTGYTCAADRAADPGFGTKLVRRWEDSTWLSAMAGSGSHLTPDAFAEMVRCGVNLPGLDQVHAGDPRLPGLVWSWAADQPPADATGRCAAQGGDARFVAEDCARALPVACRTAAGGWAVTADAVAWAAADTACAAAGHAAAGTPVNGWDGGRLRAVAGDGAVWLAYAQDDAGTWVVGGPGLVDAEPDPGQDPDRPGHGHGGRPAEPGPPVAVAPPRATTLAAAPASSSDPVPAALPVAALAALVAAAAAATSRRAARR